MKTENNDIAELIHQVRCKAANQKTNFVSYIDRLDTELLAEQYDGIVAQAPRRHHKDGEHRYLFERNGVPSSGRDSNRTEEHLAIALYLKFRAPGSMRLSDGRRLEILDYQVPLKAFLTDHGVGKIDLLGLIDGNQIAVIELKVKGGDTPIAATLEGLVYAAIVAANLEDIKGELKSRSTVLSGDRPGIIVMAPADYWQEYQDYDIKWLNKSSSGLCNIARDLSTPLQFVELKIGDLVMGLEGKSPELDGEVVTKLIFSSGQ
jgi:hypothetical protein